MPTILISPESVEGDYFAIEGDEAHHLLRVLRKKPGDAVDVTDGKGKIYHGVILFVDSEIPKAKGRIMSTESADGSKFHLRLFQGLAKGSKFDFIIEKATELGVFSLHPFLSEKNIIKIDDGRSLTKGERWQNIADAATKQCGRSVIPTVNPVLSFDDMTLELKNHRTFVLDPQETAESLKEALKKGIEGNIINIVIGPESGLSEKELEALRKVGALPVSLGRRILRTETAGLVMLSILNFELELF